MSKKRTKKKRRLRYGGMNRHHSYFVAKTLLEQRLLKRAAGTRIFSRRNANIHATQGYSR